MPASSTIKRDAMNKAYSALIRQIRSFPRDACLRWCFEQLGQYQGLLLVEGQPTLFGMFQFVKLVTMYADPTIVGTAYTSEDAVRFRNAIAILNNDYFGGYDPVMGTRVFRGLRRTAHQQFYLQYRFNGSGNNLARQILLFSPYDEQLRQLTGGLGIKDFLSLSFLMTSTMMLTKPLPTILRRETWEPVEAALSEGAVDKYLTFISCSPKELRDFLSGLPPINIEAQRFEVSPLRQRPFMRLGGQYLSYSVRLIQYFLRFHLYDRLKAGGDRDFFLKPFGETYERYIESLLKERGVTYIPERDWKINARVRKSDTPIAVDFVLPTADGVILVEAKATELSTYGQTSSDPAALSLSLKKTAIHAVVQGMTVAARLQNQPNLANYEGTLPPIYLVVPTYKELFIGNGQDAWDEFLGVEVIAELQARGIPTDVIHPPHIHFVDIEHFERFLFAPDGGESMAERLARYGRNGDGDAAQRKFNTNMWIDDDARESGVYPQVPSLKTLLDEFTEEVCELFPDYDRERALALEKSLEEEDDVEFHADRLM